MKKRIISIVLLIALISGLVAISGCEKKEENVIKIGAILPLTGKFSYYGVEEMRGMQLAENEINENNGINGNKLEIINEDSKGDSKLGISAFHKLVNVDNVKIVFTSLTGVSLAVKPLSVKNDIFQNSFAMTEDIPMNAKTIFRIYPSLEKEGKALVTYTKTLNPHNVAIIYYNSVAFEHLLKDVLIPGLKASGITNIISENFDSQDIANLNNTLLKLNRNNPDVVLIASYYNFIPSILNKIKESKLFEKSTIIGTLDIAISAIAKDVNPEAIEGVISTIPKSLFYAQLLSEVSMKHRDFFSKYKLKYKTSATYDAAYGYDSINILAEAIKETGSTEPDIISNYMRGRTFDGVNGKISIDLEGNATTDWDYVIFKDGKMNKIEIDN